MKRLGITQRVEKVNNYAEQRDCLDQRWASMSLQLGYIPLPLPNIAANQLPTLLDNLKLDGVLLSGGNSIASLNPAAEDSSPERDAFELALLSECFNRKISVVGICRGMQLINVKLGGRLSPVKGHVGERHLITLKDGMLIPEMVNSYHNWGISSEDLASELTPLAFDSAGNIEAFESSVNNLLGIMWHPEREQPFNPLDIELIKRYLL
ncbi:gamma-glutamyl-gamma-aminobutyrate hydrolase family protein [Burkholderiales bacterium]|nr:gamma-glutamyl-gamma-aminobutyrate hydrolase family protein [Burkholderiales bacterium]